MVCQKDSSVFEGTPVDFAQKCIDVSGGNPHQALMRFLKGFDKDTSLADLKTNADRMAQICLDAFDDHLASEIDCQKVFDAAYQAALEVAAFGMEWLTNALGNMGYINKGTTDLTKPAPVARESQFDPARLVVNNQICVATSSHKFGAYPTVAILLSDNRGTAVRQMFELMRRDQEMDGCKGVWTYTLRRLDLSKSLATATDIIR